MDTLGNAVLGLVFLGLAIAGTFLMYQLWGYPFDEKTLRSSAPRPLRLLHRGIGYAYFAIYLYLMSQMVPRLWSYQVEFPARTVAHLTLGMAIGAILLIKLAIVRFFKHLESVLVPFLGTTLLVCTVLLIGLSVPFAFREISLSRNVAGGTVFSPANLDRVKTLLPMAGLPAGAPMDEMASVGFLKQGRAVLLAKCVQCHDLRTILIKPRTPANWVDIVGRMAERSLFVEAIEEREQWAVSAYLIAITPELQQSVKRKRQQDLAMEKTRLAMGPPRPAAESRPAVMQKAAIPQAEERPPRVTTKTYDLAAAKQVFEATCSMCHTLSNVDNAPPGSEQEARALVARMVENGLSAPEDTLEQIIAHLTQTYGKKQ